MLMASSPLHWGVVRLMLNIVVEVSRRKIGVYTVVVGSFLFGGSVFVVFGGGHRKMRRPFFALSGGRFAFGLFGA